MDDRVKNEPALSRRSPSGPPPAPDRAMMPGAERGDSAWRGEARRGEARHGSATVRRSRAEWPQQALRGAAGRSRRCSWTEQRAAGETALTAANLDGGRACAAVSEPGGRDGYAVGSRPARRGPPFFRSARSRGLPSPPPLPQQAAPTQREAVAPPGGGTGDVPWPPVSVRLWLPRVRSRRPGGGRRERVLREGGRC